MCISQGSIGCKCENGTVSRAAALLVLAFMAVPAAARSQVRAVDRDGNAVVLPAPGTITVVQFMATWCAPCHEQTKALVALHPTYAPRGVRFAAVSLDRVVEYKLLPIYIADFSIPYPLFVGGSVDHLQRFRFGDTLPAVVLYDDEGRVFDTLPGLVPTDAITARLDWLTGDRTTPRPPRFVPPRAQREEDELPHVHASTMLAKQAGRRAGSLVPS